MSILARVKKSRLLTVVLLAVGLVASSASASADKLDLTLHEKARDIVKYLRKKGYKTVGVLDFRVKTGSLKPTTAGAMMPRHMANKLMDQLEDAQRVVDADKRVELLGKASQVAAASRIFNYNKPEDRERLFTLNYPRTYGDSQETLKADAFLAGYVMIDPATPLITNVLIVAFDKTNPKKHDRLVEFEVKTDRAILGDVGQGFSLSRKNTDFRKYLASRGGDDLDDEATPRSNNDVQAVVQTVPPQTKAATPEPARGEGSENGVTQPSVVTADAPSTPAPLPKGRNRKTQPQGVFPIKIDILYNNELMPLQRDPNMPGQDNFLTAEPNANEEVQFKVKNILNEQVGFILMVNGLSTLDRDEPTNENKMTATPWVLGPGEECLIKGYHLSKENKIQTIRGLDEKQSEELYNEMGGDARAGLIEVHVFRKAPDVPAYAATAIGGARGESDVQAQPVKAVRGRPKSLEERQAQIRAKLAASSPKIGSRGLAAGFDEGQTEALRPQTELGNVQLTDTQIIRYYTKKTDGAPPAPVPPTP